MKSFKKDGSVDTRYLPDIIRRPLGREKALGLSYVPVEGTEYPFDKPTIEVDSTHHGVARLDTEIHECLHLLYPKLSEKEVLSGGRWLARVLYKIGYRLPEDHKDD